MGAISTGVTAYRNNQFDEAIIYFNQALREKHYCIIALFWRGRTYHRLGDLTQDQRSKRAYYIWAANDYRDTVTFKHLYPNFSSIVPNAQRGLNELNLLGIEPQSFTPRACGPFNLATHTRQQ